MPTRTGTSQLEPDRLAGDRERAGDASASTPISEPTETSMLPEMMTIDMPIAATAI